VAKVPATDCVERVHTTPEPAHTVDVASGPSACSIPTSRPSWWWSRKVRRRP